MPFSTWKRNAVNSYNELVLSTTFLSLIITSTFDIGDTYMSLIGWALIAFTLLSLIFTWGLLLPALAREMFTQFTSIIIWCRGIDPKEESKKEKGQVLEKVKPSNTQPKSEEKTEDSPKKKEEKKEDIEKVQNVSNRSRGKKINTIPDVTFRPTNLALSNRKA